MEILFLTGNKRKFKEASQILPVLKRMDIDLAEIQSINPREVIAYKLKEARSKTHENLIVEDTSLFLDCMNGLPGPLIKWFLETIGNKGLVKISKYFNNNKAEARVTIGYANPDGAISFFEGSVMGRIVDQRGKEGFGWDSIFEPIGQNKTFSEMTTKEKNKISMRKIALNKLRDFLFLQLGDQKNK